jgi:hypothetical protein
MNQDYSRKQQSQILNELENYCIDIVLSGDLKQIYKSVQNELEDFRKNVFSKNIDILYEKVVIFFFTLFITIYNRLNSNVIKLIQLI